MIELNWAQKIWMSILGDLWFYDMIKTYRDVRIKKQFVAEHKRLAKIGFIVLVPYMIVIHTILSPYKVIRGFVRAAKAKMRFDYSLYGIDYYDDEDDEET